MVSVEFTIIEPIGKGEFGLPFYRISKTKN
jgi:hypothetical protein